MDSADELQQLWNPFGLRPVLRRLSLLRATVIGAQMWVKRRRQRMDVAGYMRRHGVKCLQIGAGPTSTASWLCTDLMPRRRGAVYLDATKPFPIPDACFDFVYSEHMIEHISYQHGMAMLRECHRILKPGGRVRIATPDLARLLRMYARESSGIERAYLDWIAKNNMKDPALAKPVFVINNAFRDWGHQFLYDEETLSAALAGAGFVDVGRFEPGESGTALLQGLERHGRNIGNEDVNRFETLILEARRP